MDASALIMVLLAAPLLAVVWSLLVRRLMGWANMLASLVCLPVRIRPPPRMSPMSDSGSG